MKYVLSLDGRGIWGLIPALVLAEIEKTTNQKIADLFDLIAGTSTGGILALGLCKDDGSRTPEYTAKDISKIYQEHGHIIFSRSLQHRMLSVDGLSNKKYTEKGITSILDKYFGHEPLGAALKHVLITSYDIQNREPFFFKSWRDNFQSVEMRQVARATSAAPPILNPL